MELCVDCDTTEVESSRDDVEMQEDEDEEAEAELSNGLAPARTILLHSGWETPSYHTLPLESEQETQGECEAPLPSYDEMAVREAMDESLNVANKFCKNKADDEDWEAKINK